jgi:hypothetical protein
MGCFVRQVCCLRDFWFPAAPEEGTVVMRPLVSTTSAAVVDVAKRQKRSKTEAANNPTYSYYINALSAFLRSKWSASALPRVFAW